MGRIKKAFMSFIGYEEGFPVKESGRPKTDV